MVVKPNKKSIQQMTKIMQRSLQKLYEMVEESRNNPKENMVLMVSFTMGLMIQLKEKLNTLEDELGCEYARVIYLTIENNSKIVKRDAGEIVGGEESLKLNTNNFNDAVDYLSKKINEEIYNALENMPIALKNEEILLQVLCKAITNILIELGSGNLNELINEFINNIWDIVENIDSKKTTTMH